MKNSDTVDDVELPKERIDENLRDDLEGPDFESLKSADAGGETYVVARDVSNNDVVPIAAVLQRLDPDATAVVEDNLVVRFLVSKEAPPAPLPVTPTTKAIEFDSFDQLNEFDVFHLQQIARRQVADVVDRRTRPRRNSLLKGGDRHVMNAWSRAASASLCAFVRS